MIKNQDCLEYLETLESDSVDLVLTDPPYFIGFDGGKGWDSQWKNEYDYLTWCAQWTHQCVRVLKPNRMLIVWGTLKTETFLRYKLETTDKFPVLTPQNEIIWGYNWGGRSKTNFARKHEYAWCWSKGKEFLFNDSDIRVERKLKKNIRTGQDYVQGTIPTCIWEKNNHTTSKEFCGWHPTTKNLEVLERMILAYTNPNDTVLDIFMGSGSTAIAAENSGRKYIGCERDEEYYTKSLGRIRESNPLGVVTPEQLAHNTSNPLTDLL
jgi:site-specific DNA-methyltransferase (adenine-specific)